MFGFSVYSLACKFCDIKTSLLLLVVYYFLTLWSAFDWQYVARIFCISREVMTKSCLDWGKLLYPTYEIPSMKFSS